MKIATKLSAMLAVIVFATSLSGQLLGQTTVALEDFDGGAVNLISGFDPGTENLDGGGGDWFGVGSLGNWPQVDGVPFDLVDDSAVNFPPDMRACYSLLTSDMANNFFGISDTREWNDPGMGGAPLVASWVFDISSATGALQFSVDMGQQSDGENFGGFDIGYVLFEYSIDGGPFVTAISCDQFDSTGSGFMYRLNDIMVQTNAVNVCQATGPNAITKISAEDGSTSPNTILDKCPPDGASGAGTIDTFMTDLVGSGSTLELRMTTEIPFDAMGFDNIKIVEVGGGGPVVVAGEMLTVGPGLVSGGGLPELETSDSMDLGIFRDPLSINAVTQFELTATSPTASPITFEFTLEGNVVSRPNVVQRIQLFDFVTGAYETVDERNANRTPNPDLTVTATPSGDLSRFVDQSNNEIRAQIRYRADIARAGFASNTDQAVWTIE